MSILSLLMENVKGLVVEVLSEESPTVDSSWPATRSFKALSEIAMAVVTFWSGIAQTIKDPAVYADHITAQIKMVSVVRNPSTIQKGTSWSCLHCGYPRAVLLWPSLLERLQGMVVLSCYSPMSSINRCLALKDSMTVFKHLVGTAHRRALLPHLNKLLDEQMLRSAVASRETSRCVGTHPLDAPFFEQL